MRERRAAADHVTDMLLREFVEGQVDGRKTVRLECARDLCRFAAVPDLHAHKDMRGLRLCNPVIEFGDAARAEQFAEALEAAALFGDRHREHRFTCLADFGALGDETHAVEVHVRTGRDGDQRLVLDALALRILLGARHRERACGLQHAARVLEHILDCGAERVGVHEQHIVEILAAQAKGFFADELHCRAVREQADFVQRDALARFQGGRHRA
ncbi:hypothetical protein LMG27174_07339 [Paraburkholderia rhynchosiae]|uniref:Uncharacterized protein n=1 Tax=Paraburkholderia rhynchosiae TaxID=487049 RepID=A0A6J5CYU3_9BURK|nr:hypothetical protein LMG27174_07339 [Paraburkholderia rhynchosiae]